MLNHAKVAQALQKLTQDNLKQSFDEINHAYDAWLLLCQNKDMQQSIISKVAENLVPSWQQNIGQTFSILSANFHYQLIGIDGSQIYPDRHLGFSCSLINVGTVSLLYQAAAAKACMHCEPYIFMNDSDVEQFNPIDATNARRQEMELSAAITFQQQNIATDITLLYLFDGSQIFWHLVGKEKHFFDYYFYRSIDLLNEFYKKRMPCAWYISAPKSKELISMLNLAHELMPPQFTHQFCHVRDESLMRSFLPAWHRSIIFKSNVAIAQQYPEQLRPHFVYINTNDEIGRVEFPAWIAHDTIIFEKIIAMITDQIKKGYGYPVVLAEAHEQAVVKGPDRELFFHIIAKWSMERQHKISITQKNAKKRRMTV